MISILEDLIKELETLKKSKDNTWSETCAYNKAIELIEEKLKLINT